jgi:hypothetical protein
MKMKNYFYLFVSLSFRIVKRRNKDRLTGFILNLEQTNFQAISRYEIIKLYISSQNLSCLLSYEVRANQANPCYRQKLIGLLLVTEYRLTVPQVALTICH